ncbi:MAG TPA: alanine dehydrogenase [Burkholderiales bacterium]|nr:alanine dehydrogenase [Burkholderiales bacterium]
MRIGIPREIKDQEYRVGMTPQGVTLLCREGHEVWIETNAGLRIGFPDSAYRDAGAYIGDSPAQIYACELVVKVKEPQPAEFELVRAGQVLFCYLHFAPNRKLLDRMLQARTSCVAYETVTDAGGGFPLLAPMSQIAGRLSVQVGAWALLMANGGSGVLLPGISGVAPGKVVIIGAGMVGSNAAHIAVALGADVTIVAASATRLAELQQAYPGKIKGRLSDPSILAEHVAGADLVVGAVSIAGKMAPKLISRELLRKMRPGSVLVDVSIDQGGIAETSRPTTHSNPLYVDEGVVHYCVANMPSAVARSATLALTRATLPYVRALAKFGLKAAVSADPGLKNGLQTHAGHVTYQNLAEDRGMPFVDPARAFS